MVNPVGAGTMLRSRPEETMATTSSNPSLTLPKSEQVNANGTLDVTGMSYNDSFAQGNAGSLLLTISDTSGLLYGFYPGPGAVAAPGSGSHTLSFQGSYTQVEDILNSVTYVAGAAGGSDDIHLDIWNQGGTETTGDVPVTIGGTAAGTVASGSTVPTLSEPASEAVTTGATLTVSGSYTDSTAANNPGAMYLSISDSSGTLRAVDASGNVVAGSGGNSISLNTGYLNVDSILRTLSYTAAGTSGSDTIHFDLWNQGGVETTGDVAITVTGSANGGPEVWTGAVSSDWNNAANWSGGAVPTSGDAVYIPSGTTNVATLSNASLSGETITLQGGTVDFNNVTLNSVLQASGSGAMQIGGTLTVGSAGTLDAAGNAQVIVTGASETIVNNGLVETTSGGSFVIYNTATATAATANFVNNGSVAIAGGALNLAAPPNYWLPGSLPDWSVVNRGGISIADNGAFWLNGTLSGGTIAFAGTGALNLEQPEALTGGAVVSGFGPGDQLDLYGIAGKGGALNYVNGTLDVTSNGTLDQAIALTGSLTLGNFEGNTVGSNGSPTEIVYVPGGGTSGMFDPEIAAPAAASVAQGSTLALNDISIVNIGTSGGMSVSALTGTLYMSGATGSGTHQVSVAPTSTSQLNADLASLTYVPAAGATTDIVSVGAYPPAPVETVREIPISITNGGGSASPTLNEPASETVASSGTVAVTGSYSDSFASGNAGALYLGITDSSGTLSATDASGAAVAGSGSDSIAVTTSYVDVNAILASLHYTAGAGAGADTIRFDVWNQAGMETTGATAITVDSGSTTMAMMTQSPMMASDFTTPGTTSPTTGITGNSTTGFTALGDTTTQPIGVPLTLPH
jgi:hypothetical protein